MAAKAKPGKPKQSLADYANGTPAAMPARTRAQATEERRYRAEDALRTLTRAEEHRSNPKLMADVKRLAAEHATKMARIAKK